MQKKSRKKYPVFLLLSVVLHLLIALYLSQSEAPPIIRTTKVEVEYVTPEDLAPVEEGKKSPNRKIKEKMMNQVVEQEKRINDEKDEKTHLLSAFDQKVVKQTRAQESGKFRNTAAGGKTDTGRKDGDKMSANEEEQKHKRKAHDKGDLPDLKDLTPKFSLNPGQKGLNVDTSGDPSRTDDYLKDVQSGLQTLLSTREFIYYTYYSRIKDALRQHWEPNVKEKVKIIYRKGRNIASAKDRITQVMVTLDKQGELIKVEVLSRSGVDSLDDAAVEAFRSAAPFPNPPHGMIEQDGTIKIRWDFVLEA
ncbi:MAG: energy transducer TonB [Bdellovibrionales bacterium]